jgi:hypothetical protein
MIAIDAAFVAGLGCVVGAILPIVVGIILLTWTTGELKAMLLGWLDRK